MHTASTANVQSSKGHRPVLKNRATTTLSYNSEQSMFVAQLLLVDIYYPDLLHKYEKRCRREGKHHFERNVMVMCALQLRREAITTMRQTERRLISWVRRVFGKCQAEDSFANNGMP